MSRMSEWIEIALEELVISPITYGVVKPGPHVPNGILFVRGGDITNGRLAVSELRTISNEVSKQYERTLLHGDELLISLVGDPGQVAIAPKSLAGANIARQVGLIRLSEKVNNEFVLYFLMSSEGKARLFRQTGGSVQQVINLRDIRKVKISLPSIQEQEAISSVLSSLDEKIDLLQRQNQTLEALAQAIFRQWFVEEAEDVWEEGTLGDTAVNVRDSIHHEKIPEGTIYIGLEHIEKKNIALRNFGNADTVKSNKYQFIENDILFGKLRPYFHKVCFAPFSGVCSTDILVIRPKKPSFFSYCMFSFFQNEVVGYANLGSGGTRMPRTNWKIIKDYPILVPPYSLIEDFNGLIYPLILKIKHNLKQIQTLEKLRDMLLSKFMSEEALVRID